MLEQVKGIIAGHSHKPVYERLHEGIRRGILEGHFKPATAFPSEREFVEQLGIARTTVRRALGRLQKEGLVQRRHGVGTFVAEPDQWHCSKRVLDIGIITWSAELGGYRKEVFGHVCSEAAALGMRVYTLGSGDPTGDLEIGKWVSRLRLDGVIAMGTNSRRQMRALAEVQIPKLVLEIRAPQEGLDHVVIDSAPGVYAAIGELIRLGHRDIAYVGGLVSDFDEGSNGSARYKMAQDSDERCNAYRRALEDAGLPWRPERCFELPYEQELAAKWVQERKQTGSLPTALCAFSDSLAQMLINACRGNGLEVPGQVSVVGFGNSIPESKRGELATGVYDIPSMAHLAVERVQERITRGAIPGVTLCVTSHFKNGASMGPPRRSG